MRYWINYKIIGFFMGILLLFNGGIMLLSVLVSAILKDGVTFDLTLSAFLNLSLGVLIALFCRNHEKKIQKREGYLIVTLGWILMSLSGMLPYLITGSIPNVTDAFFETISGYTTTGASILNDIESIPKGVLFWRSTTHWMGGMGIIVLTIAILPFLGIGGMQLFTAEAPGPNSDKLHPRITDTAKRLWLIYVVYTVLEMLLLYFAGMSLFDAANHAMSTLSTGGFSTKNESLAHWNNNPLIQYIVIFFMMLSGTNFVLSYFLFKGRFTKIVQDDEFKNYLAAIVIFSLLTSVILIFQVDLSATSFDYPEQFGRFESAFRHSFFQVVSVITTTGFVTGDYTQWTPFLTVVFFGLMFMGGSAGSTSGGIKVVRHMLMIKGGFLEFKRALHPNAIIQARFNKKIVRDSISYTILGFFILYMLSFIIGSLVLSSFGLSFESSIGLAASSLGNVGPALGEYGPSYNFSTLPGLAKFWVSFLMLLGRLELFTVLILFTPFFWKKH